MYKLLIFDWDGTIIDSQARIIASMQAAADELGHEPLHAEAIRNIIGLGLPEAIRALIPRINDSELERMRACYSHHFMARDQTPAQLYPGVETTLRNLKSRGYRLAVATGKSRRGLNRVLEQTGLGALFELSRCADETASKPHPLMLQEILAETALGVSDAVMIGDTEYDLEMGQRIGMGGVAVSYGAHALERLRRFAPLAEIHHFPQIESWLDSLNPATEQNAEEKALP